MSPHMSPRPAIEKSDGTMTFASCLDRLMLGERCRKLEWKDTEVYIILQDEKLMIYKTDTKKLHPLVVSTGDIVGTDWVVVGKRENLS